MEGGHMAVEGPPPHKKLKRNEELGIRVSYEEEEQEQEKEELGAVATANDEHEKDSPEYEVDLPDYVEKDDDIYVKPDMFRYEFELLDTTKAMPIIVDLRDLEAQDFDTAQMAHFVQVCYDKHALQIYDHLGDPRSFYHLEGKYIDEFHRFVGVYAFEWYRDQYPHGSEVELKEVTKISVIPTCNLYHMVTFTAVDVNTKEETTLQAQVLEYGCNPNRKNLLLGMLRDASRDQVLAAIQFKQAPAGFKTDVFWRALDIVPVKLWPED